MSLKLDITFNFANASVVMIDASPIFIEVLTGILSGYGFRKMFRCASLRVGAETVKANAVDLVLIDPCSFGEAGFEFIRSLRSEERALNASVPVIVLSAYPCVRAISNARQCGADYVIAKPFSAKALLERILHVATSEGRRGDLLATGEVVCAAGSGVEFW